MSMEVGKREEVTRWNENLEWIRVYESPQLVLVDRNTYMYMNSTLLFTTAREVYFF